MIEIEIKAGRDPQMLAALIASTQGAPVVEPALRDAAMRLQHHQAVAEGQRPTRDRMETVNFATLDDDGDWSDV